MSAPAVSRGAATLVSLLALALAGCGDDAPSLPGADASSFIGTWNVSVGSFSCLGMNLPLAGESVAVTAGGDAPIQATVRGCAVKFDISGLQATARSPQMCQVNATVGGATTPVPLTITSGSFVVVPATGGNATGVLMLAGNVTFVGMTAACQATANVNKSP